MKVYDGRNQRKKHQTKMECCICYQVKELHLFEALVCSHTFCVDCVQRLCMKRCGSSQCTNPLCFTEVKCPTCRTITTFTPAEAPVGPAEERKEQKESSREAYNARLDALIERFKFDLLALQHNESFTLTIRYNAVSRSIVENRTDPSTFSFVAPVRYIDVDSDDFDDVDSERSH